MRLVLLAAVLNTVALAEEVEETKAPAQAALVELQIIMAPVAVEQARCLLRPVRQLPQVAL